MTQRLTPATLLRRLAAALYDSLLIVALWMAGTFPVLALRGGDAIPADSWWYPLYLLGICGAFHVWFWTRGGQTLGMRAWRLKAVDTQGQALTLSHAIKRFLISAFVWLTLIGLLYSLIEARGRAAQDIFSKSDIVYLPK